MPGGGLVPIGDLFYPCEEGETFSVYLVRHDHPLGGLLVIATSCARLRHSWRGHLLPTQPDLAKWSFSMCTVPALENLSTKGSILLRPYGWDILKET
jgi:hypothetical protein